jgi:hypothetical protein
MTTVLTFLAWCVLFILCWPLAIVALLLVPLVWLLVELPINLFTSAIAKWALHQGGAI